MLKNRIIKLAWVFVDKFGMILLSILSFYVLATQLTPQQMGLGVLAIAAVEAVAVLINAVLEGPYTCVEKTSQKTDGSFFWSSIVLAVLGQILVIGVTYMVTDNQLILLLIMAASLKMLLSLAARVFIVHMRRDGKFKALAIRTLVGKIIGTVVGIVAAFYGAGAWAIVVQGVVLEFVSFAIVFAMDRRVLPLYIDIGFMKQIFKMGIPLVVSALNVDMLQRGISLLLGSVAGAVEVALYNFATRIVDLPRTGILWGLSHYALPVLSRRYNEDNKEAEKTKYFFGNATRYTFCILFPCFLGLSLLSEDLVMLVFGEKWQEAIPVLQVLSLLAAFSVMFAYISPLFLAMKKPQLTVKAQMVTSIVALVILYFFSARYGAMAAAVALCVKFVLLTPFNLIAIKTLLNVRLSYLIHLIHVSLISGAVMSAVVIYLKSTLMLSLSSFIICCLCGASSYLVTLFIFDFHWPKKLRHFLTDG